MTKSLWNHIQAKLAEFVDGAVDLTFERLAVTPDQITALGLETRPTKASGHANAAGFTRRRGKAAGTLHDSVEVDAIDSNLLRDMVRDAIERHIDQHALEITRVAERSEREVLERMAKRRRAG